MSSLLAGDHLLFSSLPPSRPIYIYWHTWSGSDKQRYSSIVARQWESLVLSKLAHYTTRICMSLPEGHNQCLPDTLLNSTKVDFQYFSAPVHEGFTLGRMKCDADEGRIPEDSHILYFHSRGASKDQRTRESRCSDDWTLMMEYFCIARWLDAIAKLQDFYTCGCQMWPMANSINQPQESIYYSPYPREFWTYCGNFWWANAWYIKNMLNPVEYYSKGDFMKDRHLMENWLLSSVGTLTVFEQHHVLHQTGNPYQRGLVHSYLDRYNPIYYIRGNSTPVPALDPDLFNGESNTRSSLRSKLKRLVARVRGRSSD